MPRYGKTYLNGSRVLDDHGYLTVTVPNCSHHMRTRSAALRLARSIWGDDVFIVGNLGPVYDLSRDRDCTVAFTRYSVSGRCQADYDAAVKRGRAYFGF